MNDEQLNKLFAAARQAKPDTSRTEQAFETRLLARLRAMPVSARPGSAWDSLFAWAWRLAPVLAAVVLVLGVWNYLTPRTSVADLADNETDQLLVSLIVGED